MGPKTRPWGMPNICNEFEEFLKTGFERQLKIDFIQSYKARCYTIAHSTTLIPGIRRTRSDNGQACHGLPARLVQQEGIDQHEQHLPALLPERDAQHAQRKACFTHRYRTE